jgi:hypothetical protein
VGIRGLIGHAATALTSAFVCACGTSITDVWASIANLFDAPRLWVPTVLGMRQTSPGPLGLGATMRGRMVVLGFETPMDVVI